jgi:hypothetical protein
MLNNPDLPENDFATIAAPNTSAKINKTIRVSIAPAVEPAVTRTLLTSTGL